ncbi:MAG TPA: AraC family transcriptional regulator [Firmicutes bacterium]|nr:AraC family transcriptional regulator [Bacillota bacterium]
MNEAQSRDFDLTVTQIRYVIHRETKPSWNLDSGRNDYFIMAYCLTGDATYEFKQERHRIKKGDLLFLPKYFPRKASTIPHAPWTFYSVAFELQFLSKGSEESLLACPNSASFPELFTHFAQLYRSWSEKRPGYLTQCRGILLDVLYRLYVRSQRFSLPYKKEIDKCLQLIHANYQHTYSSSELADLVGVSSSYFRYLFKQSTGMSPLQYQNRVRIDKAKDLLLSGECNVTEAAEAVGFGNIYYFSRLFKKLTGLSPSQYARARQGDFHAPPGSSLTP